MNVNFSIENSLIISSFHSCGSFHFTKCEHVYWSRIQLREIWNYCVPLIFLLSFFVLFFILLTSNDGQTIVNRFVECYFWQQNIIAAVHCRREYFTIVFVREKTTVFGCQNLFLEICTRTHTYLLCSSVVRFTENLSSTKTSNVCISSYEFRRNERKEKEERKERAQ